MATQRRWQEPRRRIALVILDWHESQTEIYVYAIMRKTGMSGETVRKNLRFFVELGCLEAKREATQEHVRPRHIYTLTPKGLEVLYDGTRE